jgi:hypothetical protein
MQQLEPISRGYAVLRSVKWGLLKPVSRPLLLVRLKIVVEESFVLSNTSLDMA